MTLIDRLAAHLPRPHRGHPEPSLVRLTADEKDGLAGMSAELRRAVSLEGTCYRDRYAPYYGSERSEPPL